MRMTKPSKGVGVIALYVGGILVIMALLWVVARAA